MRQTEKEYAYELKVSMFTWLAIVMFTISALRSCYSMCDESGCSFTGSARGLIQFGNNTLIANLTHAIFSVNVSYVGIFYLSSDLQVDKEYNIYTPLPPPSTNGSCNAASVNATKYSLKSDGLAARLLFQDGSLHDVPLDEMTTIDVYNQTLTILLKGDLVDLPTNIYRVGADPRHLFCSDSNNTCDVGFISYDYDDCVGRPSRVVQEPSQVDTRQLRLQPDGYNATVNTTGRGNYYITSPVCYSRDSIYTTESLYSDGWWGYVGDGYVSGPGRQYQQFYFVDYQCDSRSESNPNYIDFVNSVSLPNVYFDVNGNFDGTVVSVGRGGGSFDGIQYDQPTYYPIASISETSTYFTVNMTEYTHVRFDFNSRSCGGRLAFYTVEAGNLDHSLSCIRAKDSVLSFENLTYSLTYAVKQKRENCLDLKAVMYRDGSTYVTNVTYYSTCQEYSVLVVTDETTYCSNSPCLANGTTPFSKIYYTQDGVSTLLPVNYYFRENDGGVFWWSPSLRNIPNWAQLLLLIIFCFAIIYALIFIGTTAVGALFFAWMWGFVTFPFRRLNRLFERTEQYINAPRGDVSRVGLMLCILLVPYVASQASGGGTFLFPVSQSNITYCDGAGCHVNLTSNLVLSTLQGSTTYLFVGGNEVSGISGFPLQRLKITTVVSHYIYDLQFYYESLRASLTAKAFCGCPDLFADHTCDYNHYHADSNVNNATVVYSAIDTSAGCAGQSVGQGHWCYAIQAKVSGVDNVYKISNVYSVVVAYEVMKDGELVCSFTWNGGLQSYSCGQFVFNVNGLLKTNPIYIDGGYLIGDSEYGGFLEKVNAPGQQSLQEYGWYQSNYPVPRNQIKNAVGFQPINCYQPTDEVKITYNYVDENNVTFVSLAQQLSGFGDAHVVGRNLYLEPFLGQGMDVTIVGDLNMGVLPGLICPNVTALYSKGKQDTSSTDVFVLQAHSTCGSGTADLFVKNYDLTGQGTPLFNGDQPSLIEFTVNAPEGLNNITVCLQGTLVDCITASFFVKNGTYSVVNTDKTVYYSDSSTENHFGEIHYNANVGIPGWQTALIVIVCFVVFVSIFVVLAYTSFKIVKKFFL